MTILTYIFLGITALIATLLDISYFSFLSVAGSSILLVFIIQLILAALDLKYYSIIFASFAVLFYAGLSSVPIQYILILFIIIPLLIFYLRQKIRFDLTYFSFLFIIVGSCAVFQILLIILELNFSIQSFLSALTFIVVNSLAGIVVFSIAKIVAQKLKLVKD
ncbi:MAG: hypothetical protein WC080_01915 [Patescibacteria group bacterium]